MVRLVVQAIGEALFAAPHRLPNDGRVDTAEWGGDVGVVFVAGGSGSGRTTRGRGRGRVLRLALESRHARDQCTATAIKG